MANDDVVDIAGEVKHETAMAYLFFDGYQEVWLPKSQCEWDDYEKIMTVPEWLAMKKNLM